MSEDFTPTSEQIAVVNATKDSTANLAIIARAGAAKTSTLILIAEALPQTNILCLAFNKAIAKEMAERLPPNCEAKTLHGLGYKAWWQFIRTKCKVNDRKIYFLLRDRIDNLGSDDRTAAFESMAETLDFIKRGKQAGYLPDAYQGHWRPLCGDEDFFADLPMEPSRLQIALIQNVSAASFKAALSGEIDFDDMIFCPAICSVSWPTPTLTLIDEAQDLSPINHHILKRIVKNRRLIAVGDPCQAIYGFRGADTDSMERLISMFGMEKFHLTITFRCARAIMKNAQWRAPDMKAPEWAVEGEVLRPIDWSAESLSMGDAIICRNNAPLFSMAIKMIEADLLPEIAGRDIGGPLKKIMKKLGSPKQLRLAAINTLDDWRDKELRRARNGVQGSIHDKHTCILIMLERTKDLGDAIAYLEHLLARDGRIHLMTGHKSKGLEFDTVWFLDSDLCRIKHEQDANIKYVIETRAKLKLVYVTAESFEVVDTIDEMIEGVEKERIE